MGKSDVVNVVGVAGEERLELALEERGILLCCMGARPDVWASGMLASFSDGATVVTLEAQRAAFLDAHPALKARLIAKGTVPAPGTAPVQSAEDQQDCL
ncbi:hypothetical protein [Lentzea sp. CA-135723]|uniref:hypothetical protein n=1 Tax=Lentzea sp. CA-135723 TaxID=3239950 RepID=UPI003D933A5F